MLLKNCLSKIKNQMMMVKELLIIRFVFCSLHLNEVLTGLLASFLVVLQKLTTMLMPLAMGRDTFWIICYFHLCQPICFKCDFLFRTYFFMPKDHIRNRIKQATQSHSLLLRMREVWYSKILAQCIDFHTPQALDLGGYKSSHLAKFVLWFTTPQRDDLCMYYRFRIHKIRWYELNWLCAFMYLFKENCLYQNKLHFI